MNLDSRDPIDRTIDEAIASMVGGEPRRVSGASVRQAMGESRRSGTPVWLAAAAVLVVGFAVALRMRAPVGKPPVSAARAAPGQVPVEVRAAPPELRHAASPARAALRSPLFATAAEPADEGLPRVIIASMDPLEPLGTSGLAANPIEIPQIEVIPLNASSLSNEQEQN